MTSVYLKTLLCSGIHQGSNALYQHQPIQGRYERGHLVPISILSYSPESALATFTFTNCVPQIAGFNKGQWRKYELRIEYAPQTCSPKGGTLFLITGTSSVTFARKINHLGDRIVKSVEPLWWFHDDVDVNQKIATPNSMWTVGCCLNLNNKVVGAFGVMGYNSLNENEILMSTQNVKSVGSTLQLEDPTIKLFPKGKDCYDLEKNVELDEI